MGAFLLDVVLETGSDKLGHKLVQEIVSQFTRYWYTIISKITLGQKSQIGGQSAQANRASYIGYVQVICSLAELQEFGGRV